MSDALAILVIDDNRDLRRLMELSLERAGFPVLHAVNGLSAMRLVNDMPHRIGLVICDVVLPDISGIDLLESLQALAPELQGLLITGDPHRVPDSCRFQVLPKPFAMGVLLTFVRGATAEQPVWAGQDSPCAGRRC